MKALPVIDFLDEKWKSLDHIFIRFVVPEMHLLILECFVERLHESVVVRIALGRHADLETVLAKLSNVVGRGVLNSTVGVVDAAASWAACQGHL